MPTDVPIEVFRIAHTVVDKDEVQRWMDFLGANEFDVDELGEVCTNPAALIALAGKRCYLSFQPSLNPNISRIRKEYVKYFDNILRSGHGSVVEHSTSSFAMENVSRVFTSEMNRHRAGWAISEGSLRFIRFGENIPYWLPDSLKGPDVLGGAKLEILQEDDPDDVTEQMRFLALDTEEKKRHASRVAFRRAFGNQEQWYNVLQAIWSDELKPESKFKGKKQITSMMRRIIGLGVATGGVWTGNMRALRHVIAMRASPAAEEEILYVFSRIAKMMVEKEPMLFGDFEETAEGFWVPSYPKV